MAVFQATAAHSVEVTGFVVLGVEVTGFVVLGVEVTGFVREHSEIGYDPDSAYLRERSPLGSLNVER